MKTIRICRLEQLQDKLQDCDFEQLPINEQREFDQLAKEYYNYLAEQNTGPFFTDDYEI